MGNRFAGLSAVLLGLVVGASAFGANTGSYHCKNRHDLVGPCWTVHGRLRVGNGTPSARIWPIGTHRLLGVEDEFFNHDEEFAAPAALRQFGFGTDIFADFFVCPLTKSKSGVMQMVCISGAKFIHVKHYLDKHGKSKISWQDLQNIGGL